MIILFLFILTVLTTYTGVGVRYARSRYAELEFERQQMGDCTNTCNSHEWSGMSYKKEFCTCGFLSGKPRSHPFVLLAAWPLYKTHHYLTTGQVAKPNYAYIEKMEAEMLDK